MVYTLNAINTMNDQSISDPTEENNGQSAYSPDNSESLSKTRSGSPVTSSPGEAPYTGSHADNYDPDSESRNVPDDGPSGENTQNGGERGGGLWTSGGTVTTGTPYHDEDDPAT